MHNIKKKLSILILATMLGTTVIPINSVYAENAKEEATVTPIQNGEKLIEKMTYTGKGIFTTNILEESLKKCVDDQGGGDGKNQEDASKKDGEETDPKKEGEEADPKKEGEEADPKKEGEEADPKKEEEEEEKKKSVDGWASEETIKEIEDIGSVQDDNKVQETMTETAKNATDTLNNLADATCEQDVSIYKDLMNVTRPVVLTNITALMGIVQYVQGIAYALIAFMVVFYGYELMFKREEAPDIFRFSFKLASTVLMIMLSPYIFQDLLNLNNIMVYYIGTMEVYKSTGVGAYAEAVVGVGTTAIMSAIMGILGIAIAGAGIGLIAILFLLFAAIALIVPILKLMLWWYVRLFTLTLMFAIFPLFILLIANDATSKTAKRFFVTVIAEIFSQTFFAIGYTVATILLLNLGNLKESMGFGLIGQILLSYVILSSLATFPETAKSWLGGSDSMGYKSMANNLAKSVEGIGKSVMKGGMDRQRNKVNSPTNKEQLHEKMSNGQSLRGAGQGDQSDTTNNNFKAGFEQVAGQKDLEKGKGEETKTPGEKILNDLKSEENQSDGQEGNQESAKQDGGGKAQEGSGSGSNPKQSSGEPNVTGGKGGSGPVAGDPKGSDPKTTDPKSQEQPDRKPNPAAQGNKEQNVDNSKSEGNQHRMRRHNASLQKAQEGDSVAKQAVPEKTPETIDEVAGSLAKDMSEKDPNSAFGEDKMKEMLSAMMGKGGAVPREEDVKEMAEKMKEYDQQAYQALSTTPGMQEQAQALKEKMESDEYKNSAENFIQQAKDMGMKFADSKDQGLSDGATKQLERGLMNGKMSRSQAVDVVKNDLMKNQGLSEKEASAKAEAGIASYEKGSLGEMSWEGQRAIQATHKKGQLDEKKFSEIIKNDQIHHKGNSDMKAAQGHAEMMIATSGLNEHVQRKGNTREAKKSQASTYKASQQTPLSESKGGSSKGGEKGDSPS